MSDYSIDREWRSKKPRKEGWRRQEDRLPGIQPGGRKQPGSGSGKGASRKGDGRGELLLVSAKTTEARSIRVERGWLEGIAQQAQNVRLVPALLFGFDSEGDGRLDWMAFEAEAARSMVETVCAVRRGDFEAAREAAAFLSV